MALVHHLEGDERLATLQPPDVSGREKNPGRFEDRMVWVVNAHGLAPYLKDTLGWGSIGQVGCIYRRRRQDEHRSQEWTTWLTHRFGGASLAHAALLGAAEPLGSENGVHCRRDVTYQEDLNPARITAQALAWARNLALSLARLRASFPAHLPTVAPSLKRLGGRPECGILTLARHEREQG